VDSTKTPQDCNNIKENGYCGEKTEKAENLREKVIVSRRLLRDKHHRLEETLSGEKKEHDCEKREEKPKRG
jgi:hypothetical protein